MSLGGGLRPPSEPPPIDCGGKAAARTAYHPFHPGLLGFFVGGVLPAPPAKLLQLHPIRVRPLVLRGRVVPPLTRRAREGDDVPHGASPRSPRRRRRPPSAPPPGSRTAAPCPSPPA